MKVRALDVAEVKTDIQLIHGSGLRHVVWVEGKDDLLPDEERALIQADGLPAQRSAVFVADKPARCKEIALACPIELRGPATRHSALPDASWRLHCGLVKQSQGKNDCLLEDMNREIWPKEKHGFGIANPPVPAPR